MARAAYPPAEQERFADWLQALRGKADVVMVHAPALAQLAVDALADDPPRRPLVLVEGHTHRGQLRRQGPLTILNPGSIGGGGTGNLTELGGEIGLARLTYSGAPFIPRAADLVRIDPGSGNAQARRSRLGEE